MLYVRLVCTVAVLAVAVPTWGWFWPIELAEHHPSFRNNDPGMTGVCMPLRRTPVMAVGLVHLVRCLYERLRAARCRLRHLEVLGAACAGLLRGQSLHVWSCYT